MRSTIFRRALDRVVSAREKKVRLYVTSHLLSLDDATLKAFGRSREEIQREGLRTASL